MSRPHFRSLSSSILMLLLTAVVLEGCAGNGGPPANTPTSTATTGATVQPPSTPTAPAITNTPTSALTNTQTSNATVTPTASVTSTPTGDTSAIDLLPTPVATAIATLVAGVRASQHVPGVAVAVALNGQTVFAEGYGYAMCATSTCDSGNSVYADTPFELGSVTKSFTTVGLLYILDNPFLNRSDLGALDLDAPISQYLDSDTDFTFSQTWANITTRQLLSMSSGIEDFGSNTLTWYQILTNVGMNPLVFSSGTNYCYSNPGFMTVGAIIQQLTTLAYSKFMQSYVFEPLNMPNTLIHTPDNTPPSLATGYAYDSSTSTWSVPMQRPPLSSFSAGAIISTAVDLGMFLSAMEDRALLSTSSYQLMWTDESLQDPTRQGPWGLGWEVNSAGAYQIYRKDGGLPGITSQLSLYDSGAAQIGVAVATNEDMASGLATLNADIISAVLQTPVPNPAGAGDGCTPTPCFNCPTETPTPLVTPTPT